MSRKEQINQKLKDNPWLTIKVIIKMIAIYIAALTLLFMGIKQFPFVFASIIVGLGILAMVHLSFEIVERGIFPVVASISTTLKHGISKFVEIEIVDVTPETATA